MKLSEKKAKAREPFYIEQLQRDKYGTSITIEEARAMAHAVAMCTQKELLSNEMLVIKPIGYKMSNKDIHFLRKDLLDNINKLIDELVEDEDYALFLSLL